MSRANTNGGRRRRGSACLIGLVLAVGVVGLTVPAAAAPPQQPPSGDVLPDRMRGEQAIAALGDRLPDVAARNGLTPDALRHALRTERELWVGPSGTLLFVDDTLADHAAEPATSTVEPAFTDIPTSAAFTLHSRPGADRVVYLDFDGFDAPGSGWSGKPGTPYDADGDPTSFSDAERREVIDVWRRVAEDFAPFAIDVTTEDPGIDDIRRTTSTDQQFGTRVVITPPMTDCTGCGGVAYLGTYDTYGGSDSQGWTHDRYQPAWVYTSGVGTGAKNIAEAASHEAGHNLGLFHDATASEGYYKGHGDWAPIMGVGYYEPVTQWSRGEYAGATDGDQANPDDFVVIGGNGGPLAADDHGDVPGTATMLGDPVADAEGTIGTAADVDAFAFTATTGDLSIRVDPVAVGANLDVGLRLVDAAGATVATADGTGLAAELRAALAPGNYAVLVEGVGAGDPLTTGYSDYGSVGRYRLTGTLPLGDPGDPGDPGTPSAPEAPVLAQPPATTDGSVALAWTAAEGADSYVLYRESLHVKSGQWKGRTAIATTTATSWTDQPGNGTFRYQVEAVNALGRTLSNTVQVTVQSGSGGGGKGGGRWNRTPPV